MKRALAGFLLVAFFLIFPRAALADGPDNVQYVVKGTPVWNPECDCGIFSNLDGKLPCEPGIPWYPPTKEDLVILEPNSDGVVEICGFFRVRGGLFNEAGWIPRSGLQRAEKVDHEFIPILGHEVYKNPCLVGQSDTWQTIARKLKIPEYSLKAGNPGNLYPGRTIWYFSKSPRTIPR